MSSATGDDNDGAWLWQGALVAFTLQILRLSMEIVQIASEKSQQLQKLQAQASAGDDQTTATEASDKQRSPPPVKTLDDDDKKKSASTKLFFEKKPSYGATGGASDEENQATTPLLQRSPQPPTRLVNMIDKSSMWCQGILAIGLIAIWATVSDSGITTSFVILAALALLLGAWLSRSDARKRFGWFQKTFYFLSSLTLWAVVMAEDLLPTTTPTSLVGIILFLALFSLYFMWTILEVWWVIMPEPTSATTTTGKTALSTRAILALLKPYFWPDKTDCSAAMNRIRAIMTWVCVILSKTCNLISPILLGWASTALAHGQYRDCAKYSILYTTVAFFGSTFREAQSLVYLKVAQAAFVQLSETAFAHLHSLSLDWHLRKKLGEVLRSMDRGIAACDTLMKYLFLWLVPAMAECLVVCVVFATYFSFWPLAVSVFYFVFVYVVWTILVTVWRKQFRKAVVKSDNDWHDRCTDSLINFETVKYFTAEGYELERFAHAVEQYQTGTVRVQASLSFLNISQQLLLQTCLATSLSLAAYGIRERINCCVDHGCDSGISDCCLSVEECPGMQVGDFVAVLSYTLNLFTPLNFLGSVYNAVVMAMIDLTSLSELLAESPDIKDAPNAKSLPPRSSSLDDDVVVEFKDVVFRYPTQPSTKGLKGVSFQMKRGTTTAIVGPTGAGKTTVSRLLFRFYDVLDGCVKIHGQDIRGITQSSLRGSIGVVPQAASMFNDTLKANLLYGRRNATDDDIKQAAVDAQLWPFIESLDEGWMTMVGDRGLKLSGGEKQRAAIARCLLKDPPIVILDEATSALDTVTERSVQEALDRLGQDRTVLVIAHRLGTIRNADNIVVLKDGYVAEQGTHDELLRRRKGIYAEMWNMQLHNISRGGSRDELSMDDF